MRSHVVALNRIYYSVNQGVVFAGINTQSLNAQGYN